MTYVPLDDDHEPELPLCEEESEDAFEEIIPDRRKIDIDSAIAELPGNDSTPGPRNRG
jgi:hypothetical protein